jgi:hypothetical protein
MGYRCLDARSPSSSYIAVGKVDIDIDIDIDIAKVGWSMSRTKGLIYGIKLNG